MKGRIAVAAGAAIVALAATIVRPWEGYEPTPYLDIVGVRTVCYGQTGSHIENRTYSKAECEAMLQSELGKYLSELDACIHKPLRRHEWAALLSLAYNAGVPAICGSTLVRKVNAGAGPAEFCPELRKWVYAGGRKVKGLERRREAEYRVCMGYEP
ncbi:lysozyme [Pseudoxanthomonas koreensis]|uniref:lysozyme n=1 Tax=Pseudoxanthomonas koreensis TaxID=266061 RepID=UPI001390D204|nr:lysozyme [Pseudoxanthomonas koreensis]KAF1692665.1 lysozyme [Pseudoxanthomonas koreensis]